MIRAVRRRIVGTTFIAALLIIIIPEFFNSSPESDQKDISSLPNPPGLPKQDKLLAKMDNLNIRDINNKLTHVNTKLWYLQLGSYLSMQQASQKQKVLASNSIKSIVSHSKLDDKYYIYVGPNADQSDLRKLQENLSQLGNTKSRIIPSSEYKQVAKANDHK